MSVPTCVMLGWRGCVTTRAVLALATFPVMAAAVRFEIPEPLLATTNPWITSPESVPRDVTLGWAGCVTTRAVFELATFPTRAAL